MTPLADFPVALAQATTPRPIGLVRRFLRWLRSTPLDPPLRPRMQLAANEALEQRAERMRQYVDPTWLKWRRAHPYGLRTEEQPASNVVPLFPDDDFV